MLKTRIGYSICFSIILSLFVYSKSIHTKSMEVSFSQPNSDKSEQERIQELEQRLDSLEPSDQYQFLILQCSTKCPFSKNASPHIEEKPTLIEELTFDNTHS